MVKQFQNVEMKTEILLVFFAPSAQDVFDALSSVVGFHITSLGINDANFDPNGSEKQIAESKHIIFVLSNCSLASPSFQQSILTAHEYQKPIIFLHHVASCDFPADSDIPDLIKPLHLFEDKAIPFMIEYAHFVVDQIQSKIHRLYLASRAHDLLIVGSETQGQQHFEKIFPGIEAVYLLCSRMKKQDLIAKLNECRSLVLTDCDGVDLQTLQAVVFQAICNKQRIWWLTSTKQGQKTMEHIAKNAIVQFEAKVVETYFSRTRTNQMQPTKWFEGVIKSEIQQGNCCNVAIKTRAFLSHRRKYAQGLAGRIYESLKDDYNVFLDTAVDFDIHKLDLLVSKTQVFIFILSKGIFESYYCMQELRSAIQNKIRIVIVRDYKCQLPDVFPGALQDVETSLRNAPTISYMAEFHIPFIEKLRSFLGPTDKIAEACELTSNVSNLSQNAHETLAHFLKYGVPSSTANKIVPGSTITYLQLLSYLAWKDGRQLKILSKDET